MKLRFLTLCINPVDLGTPETPIIKREDVPKLCKRYKAAKRKQESCDDFFH